MNTKLVGMVKFGGTIVLKDGKKEFSGRPSKWQKLKSSLYKNEPNYGILTGKLNDIIVIDLDNKDPTFKGLVWFEKNICHLTQVNTLVTTTFNKGYHVYFRYTSKIKGKKLGNLNIDVLSDGSCCYEGRGYDILYDKEIRELSSDEINIIIDAMGTKKELKVEVVEPLRPLELVEVEYITEFVTNTYHHKRRDIREIFIDKGTNCITVALHERECPFLKREHTSNHQYIIIDTYSAKQKCHDPDCAGKKHTEIKLRDYPKNIKELVIKVLKTNKKEHDLITKAIKDCQSYINGNFDTDAKELEFDEDKMMFKGDASRESSIILRGKCTNCKVEHQIGKDGYCMKCNECESKYPMSQMIPIENKGLAAFWANYSQLVNNGTVNININNYGEESADLEYQIDDSILRDSVLTKLVNESLDGHKISKISKLVKVLNDHFVYSNNCWYMFNGKKWQVDKDNIDMKVQVLELTTLYGKAKTYYANKRINVSSMSIIKNIKSLENKLNKPGFKDEIIKEAKLYYHDDKFRGKLNSKKHLVPFENGVYNLLNRRFEKTKREDYIEMTVNYDYNSEVRSAEVQKFLEQVIGITCVRDYVLKKMSECLNGDIPNTNFMMLIGDSGANGKSQLLNLMKHTMGEFGEKVEVTLLTRKRNNANETNSEKIKLMNTRFAFLSEPEDGEKINIGLLKEVTGSEEIVARGLYQESMTFVMEAKLFLACNELPEIKGEDSALWRRIRVVDFPSRFVDEPKATNEYKIDRTLPSRMREDITWRQTFMNVLLEYYYKDVKEPNEVKAKTKEYKDESNDIGVWLEENIENRDGSILTLADILACFLNGKDVKKKEMTKHRKNIENWLKESKIVDVWEIGTHKQDKRSVKGWKGLGMKNEES